MSPLQQDLRIVLGLDAEARPKAIAPRLIVLTRNGTDRSGGAIAIGTLIVADARLTSAPVDVRQAVLAHELGHIRLGHTAAMSAAFVAAALYATSTVLNPPTPLWVLVNCALLCALGAFALWATRPAREFEADRYAAMIVGRESVARALRWSIGSEPPSPLASSRLAVLEDPALR
jgi:Zn-dependent protease with chaperone function